MLWQLLSVQPKVASLQPKVASLQPKVASLQPKVAPLQPKAVSLQPNKLLSLHSMADFFVQAGTIFVMTHDSIGLGEDGPTHQPIEHLASFRAMPNILMMRPGDGNETAGCYKARHFVHSLHLPTHLHRAQTDFSMLQGAYIVAGDVVLRSKHMKGICACHISCMADCANGHICLKKCACEDAQMLGHAQVAVENNRGINQKGYGRPTILALSRQGVPNLPGTSKEGVAKGGYIVHGGDGKPDAIIMATGTFACISRYCTHIVALQFRSSSDVVSCLFACLLLCDNFQIHNLL